MTQAEDIAARRGWTVVDSRRLTGTNRIWSHPSAILDVAGIASEDDLQALEPLWREFVGGALEAVGWEGQKAVARRCGSGVSFVLSAPLDGLYAATELNEWAFDAALLALDGAPPSSADRREALERLRKLVSEEALPAVVAMAHAAGERDLHFLSCDDYVTVGSGTGSRTWPRDETPEPENVDWDSVHNVPVVRITGTNGKTTTARLLARMVQEDGRTVGLTSSDWVTVGSDILDEGDCSGPGSARLALRDLRTETAILETARGGLLRRGLGLDQADVSVLTNVAEDHLGEFALETLDDLARLKWVAMSGSAHLVLNADDEHVVGLASELELDADRVTWFSTAGRRTEAERILERHIAQGGTSVFVEASTIVSSSLRVTTVYETLAKIPIALGGAARHNISNAAAAVAAGDALGLAPQAMRRALREFGRDAADNPGRLTVLDLRSGARALVDFAHNPHGLDSLLETAAALKPHRLLVSLAQAGDRTDEAVLELVRTVWRHRPDHFLLKELPDHLRGREPGEVTQLMGRELSRFGVPSEHIETVSSESEAVDAAVRWAREGDLLLLITHADRNEVLERLAAHTAD